MSTPKRPMIPSLKTGPSTVDGSASHRAIVPLSFRARLSLAASPRLKTKVFSPRSEPTPSTPSLAPQTRGSGASPNLSTPSTNVARPRPLPGPELGTTRRMGQTTLLLDLLRPRWAAHPTRLSALSGDAFAQEDSAREGSTKHAASPISPMKSRRSAAALVLKRASDPWPRISSS